MTAEYTPAEQIIHYWNAQKERAGLATNAGIGGVLGGSLDKFIEAHGDNALDKAKEKIDAKLATMIKAREKPVESENDPQSHQEAENSHEDVDNRATDEIASPVTYASQEAYPHLYAGNEVSFSMFTATGIEMRYTLRAETADDLAKMVEDQYAVCAKRGYKAVPTSVEAKSAQMSATPSTASTPANAGDTQTAKCVLIKPSQGFNPPHNPLLEFTVQGLDKPIKITKKIVDQVKALANIRKLDGSLFVEADLQIGELHAGMWLVEYKKSPDGVYNNFVSIRSA